MTVYSCMNCDKRYPGCHGKCAEYLEQKAKHDAAKAAYDQKRRIDYAINSQRSKKVYQATKNRQKGKRYEQ